MLPLILYIKNNYLTHKTNKSDQINYFIINFNFIPKALNGLKDGYFLNSTNEYILFY